MVSDWARFATLGIAVEVPQLVELRCPISVVVVVVVVVVAAVMVVVVVVNGGGMRCVE